MTTQLEHFASSKTTMHILYFLPIYTKQALEGPKLSPKHSSLLSARPKLLQLSLTVWKLAHQIGSALR